MDANEALFQPGYIGKLQIRNRSVMSAMGGVVSGDGKEGNQRAIDFYAERAKGGAGLIIMPTVVSTEANLPGVTSYDSKAVQRMGEIAAAVKSHGARMGAQLGYVSLVSWPAARQVGPSAVPCFTHQLTPRALSIEEIEAVVAAIGEAALKAKYCGMDAVEIQSAHGYFLSAFMSPFLNRRTDKYGGNLENRARFTCEVIRQVRNKVGADFPVLIRMNGSDFLEGGLTNAEAVIMAQIFVEAGIDAINVSAGIQDTRQWRDLSYLYPDGVHVPLAAAIKKAVKVPVIAAGKIGDPALACRIIAEGKADFVSMARALLSDPALMTKSREGQGFTSCIYCNNCRFERTSADGTRKRGIACTVNPDLGREREFILKPATVAKKVMVIGGGLAGLEAARVMAERGHQVNLHEKSGQLGGQWNIACQMPQKEKFKTVLPRLIAGLSRAGVKVFLNSEVTAQTVREQKLQALVLATGAVPLSMDVPGINDRNVVQAVDVISGKAKVGHKVVVIGGRLGGMEAAELLAGQGKQVSLATRKRLGGSGEPLERNIFITLRDRLIGQGVMIFPFAPVFEIRENGVYVVLDNELLFLQADTVVLAVGARPANALLASLKDLVPEVYAIGDCARVRDAREAINEGAEIGRRI